MVARVEITLALVSGKGLGLRKERALVRVLLMAKERPQIWLRYVEERIKPACQLRQGKTWEKKTGGKYVKPGLLFFLYQMNKVTYFCCLGG